MRISRWLLLTGVLLATAFASADTVPLPDPQLDFLGGVGSVSFTGQITIDFTLSNGILTCSAEGFEVASTSGQNTCTLGSFNDAFANNTGADIRSFNITFENQQGPFTAGASSLFGTVIPNEAGTGAIYSGGDIAPCVPNANTACGLPTQCIECIGAPTSFATSDGPTTFTEFYMQFTGVVVGPDGTTKAILTSSPLSVSAPEPSSMLLLGCGAGLIGLVRRKIRR